MSNMKSKEGWLKVKFRCDSKWHQRYCVADSEKSILFFSSKVDSRFREWIRLSPKVIISEYDTTQSIECRNGVTATYVLQILEENKKDMEYLQLSTKADMEEWLLVLKYLAYRKIGGAIFGQSLDETYQNSPDRSTRVPIIIRECCEYLLIDGLNCVGLFRTPGKLSSVRELRELFDRGIMVKITAEYPAPTISSLLKCYLQSLPEPIIPFKHFYDYLEVGSHLKYNRSNLSELKRLIDSSLSETNYEVLGYLCKFLKALTNYVEQTKMSTDNLAIVFQNSFIRSPEETDLQMHQGNNYNLLPLIGVLIDECNALFTERKTVPDPDTPEHTDQSIAKSSGFSSVSSLVSTNQSDIENRPRSMSLPSIDTHTGSSIDSANQSCDSTSDLHERENHHPSFSSNTTSSTIQAKALVELRQKQCNNIDFSDVNETFQASQSSVTSYEQNSPEINNRRSLYIPEQTTTVTTSELSTNMRKSGKSSKKSFTNRLSKPFSNLKLTKNKGLEVNDESVNQTKDEGDSESKSNSKTMFDASNYHTVPSKHRKEMINYLHSVIDQRDKTIEELSSALHQQSAVFGKEIKELQSTIGRLTHENEQLKRDLANCS